jgi:hypothetical protein
MYNGVPIFYGVGNFLFDKQTDFQAWHKGLILKLDIEDKKINNWTLYPVIQCLTELNVKLAHQDQKDEILAHIAEINKVIADDDLLEAKFRQFALDRKDFVLSHYSTSYFIDHPYFRSLIRKLRLSRLFLRKNQIRAAYNFSRCESVRETAQVVFDDFLQTGKSK